METAFFSSRWLSPFSQVSLKDNTNLTKDSNVTIEIPISTTLAYGVSELVIHQDGRFGEWFFLIYIFKLHWVYDIRMSERVLRFLSPNENVCVLQICV